MGACAWKGLSDSLIDFPLGSIGIPVTNPQKLGRFFLFEISRENYHCDAHCCEQRDEVRFPVI